MAELQPNNINFNMLKILVVEDNQDTRLTICEMLSLLEYDAVGLSNGTDALDYPEKFDILITDYNLPGMNGSDLVSKIHALHPQVPIVISSGMDIPINFPFEIHLLPKPFDMMTLSHLLKKLEKETSKKSE